MLVLSFVIPGPVISVHQVPPTTLFSGEWKYPQIYLCCYFQHIVLIFMIYCYSKAQSTHRTFAQMMSNSILQCSHHTSIVTSAFVTAQYPWSVLGRKNTVLKIYCSVFSYDKGGDGTTNLFQIRIFRILKMSSVISLSINRFKQ